MIDSIAAFMEHHANDLDLPLLAETREDVKKNFNVLKEHLFSAQQDYFHSHKPEMYGTGKEMFHTFAKLLQEKRVPLQQRMDAVQNLSSKAWLCSGGVLSELEEATAVLMASAYGLRGVAHQWKIKMAEALILQYVKARHHYEPIWEVHYINAYYNHLADRMGVRKRTDPYVSDLFDGRQDRISEENLRACMAHVFAKIKPTQMAADLASQYRSRIEGSLYKENIAADNIGLDGFSKLNTAMQALKPEYGDVAMRALLEQPDPDNDELYAYIGRKQPIKTTRHFLKALKQQEMISYDKKSKLVLAKTDEGRMMMLDDMLWVKEGKDKHAPIHELTASSLIKLAPRKLLDTIKKAEPEDAQARNVLLRNVIQHMHKSLEAAGNMKEQLGLWLRDFAAVMVKKKHAFWRRSSWQAGWSDPVIPLAAALGQVSVMEDLLQAGGNINATDEGGRTGLILAAQGGHVEMVKALIEKGVNIKAKDHEGNTALIHAARQGKVDMVKDLVRAGRRRIINVAGANKRSALQEAAAAGHVGVVKALLTAGADKDAKDAQGRTALMLAVEQGHVGVVKALLTARADKDARDENEKTPLISAAEQGHVEIVEALLKAGADKNAADKNGKTPLISAAEQGHAEVVKALLKAGAWVKGRMEARDKNGKTPLIWAAEQGHVEVVEVLLEAEVNKNTRDKNGKTPLTLAVEKGHAEVVEVLLKSMADKNAKDGANVSVNVSALMEAARNGLVAAAKVLIQHGADGREELIDLATRRNEFEAQAAMTSFQRLKATLYGGSEAAIEIAKNLLEAGADGATALLELAQQNSKSALSVLIKAGADKAKDTQGKTALMKAVEMTASENERDSAKGLQILKTLFEAGADIEITDNEGRTAEAYAERVAGLGSNKAFLAFLEVAASKKEGSWAFWK